MTPGEKVQNFPASLISSELSAHQMPPSADPGSALPNEKVESHPIEDALAMLWTLVDQRVIPPGYEEAFRGFAASWVEAAERDDERKASWDNVSAGVTLEAQRKVQEDKVRQDAQSRNQRLSEPSARRYLTREPPHAKTRKKTRGRGGTTCLRG